MPNRNRGNTNQMRDDYRVKVIDRRSKYDQDVEQVLSKGLSKAELDKALTSLRKDFIHDLEKLAKDTTDRAISSFMSKQNKANRGNEDNSSKNSPIQEVSKNILASSKESKAGFDGIKDAVGGMSKKSDGLKGFLGDLATKANTKMSGIFGSSPGGGIGAGGVLQILWKIYQVAGQIASITNNIFSDSINKAINDQQE